MYTCHHYRYCYYYDHYHHSGKYYYRNQIAAAAIRIIHTTTTKYHYQILHESTYRELADICIDNESDIRSIQKLVVRRQFYSHTHTHTLSITADKIAIMGDLTFPFLLLDSNDFHGGCLCRTA